MSSRSDGLWVRFGLQVRDARLARRWTVADLARRAGVSAGMIYRVEAGGVASTETATRIATALGRRAGLLLTDPRRRRDARHELGGDPVHSAMGELEARHLRALGVQVGLDEPYQHYQFAGRADLIAWDPATRTLLHIENRTRFPDFQEMAGSFNAKRAYLGDSLAERFGVRGWASQTHVIAGLWSSEVLHAIRLRPESFRSICPDVPDAFASWWAGQPPRTGITSTLVVIDPLATRRQRPWVGLGDALTARPRHRGYADTAFKLASAA